MQPNIQEDNQIRASRDLAAELPLNDFGLPLGVYRTDLLPWHDYMPAEQQRALHLVKDETPINVVSRELIEQSTDAVTGAMADLGIFTEGDDEDSGDIDSEVPIAYAPARTATPIVNTVEGGDVVEVLAEHRIAGFRVSDLENAFVWLHYDEGFPSFDSGQPFWGCLPFEPPKAYEVFQRYLQVI